jgi:hypothetical protein
MGYVNDPLAGTLECDPVMRAVLEPDVYNPTPDAEPDIKYTFFNIRF